MLPTENEITEILTEETKNVSSLFTEMGNFIKGILPSLAFAAVVFLMGVVVIRIVMRALHRSLDNSKADRTAASFLHSLVRAALYAILAVIVLSVVGVPMTSIITVIGTVGLAIGLALQNSLSNIAGGFIILFAKPLKVGDFVEFGGIKGTVESIAILQTKLRRDDGTTVFIPNGKISDAVILNYTETPQRRLDLSFGIGYGDDAALAKSIISGILREHPNVLQTPAPTVRIGNFADSAVEIYVRVWTTHEHYWTVHYDLHEQVKAAFDEKGIGIPYPQMDVHLERSAIAFQDDRQNA